MKASELMQHVFILKIDFQDEKGFLYPDEILFLSRSVLSPSVVGENVFIATKRGCNFRFINATTFISVRKSKLFGFLFNENLFPSKCIFYLFTDLEQLFNFIFNTLRHKAADRESLK